MRFRPVFLVLAALLAVMGVPPALPQPSCPPRRAAWWVTPPGTSIR